MFGNLIFGATLIASASAHVALWDKGMFGYNYPKQVTDSQDWNNNIPVEPLRQSDGLSVDQWFGHGYKGFPPKSGDFMILPAGGVYTGELNCNRAGTRMRDPARTDPLPTYACDGEGALHVMNRFNATVDPKWFGGTALAIAYTSDINALQPNDMTVISVNTQSPWFRETAYPIPAGLPPCPVGGCLCSWNWIHQANHGEGYGQEIYNLLYRCKVTGDTDSSATLSKPAIPKDCTGNPGACVKGPKTPMYVYQASGNNLPNLAVPPNYNDNWGFKNGAQDDIFAPTTTSPDYTSPTATSLPSGWSSMGCYVDQDPRSLPVFLFSRTNNTIESCVSACATGGNSYAGVEGPECWCAKSNPTLVAAKASDCNKPCGGDTWATCGGDWRLNVYKTANAPSVATTVSPAATVVPTPISSAELPKGWTAVGCVIDQDYPRTLDAGAVSSDNTTIEGCIAIAQAKGLPYAGVQYGQECWMGTSASKANIKLGTGCDVPCAGDRSTICGGSYRLNVFVNNALLGDDILSSSAAPIVPASSTSSQTSSTSTARSSATVPASSTTAVTTVSSATSIAPTSTTPIASTASSAAAVSSSSSTLPAGWKDLGCQIDSSKPRLLSEFFINNNKQNSAKYCISLCASKGFSYAGTEYGTQCFCGNNVKLKPASSADCSSKCASGDGKCGGVYRLNLYGIDGGSTVVQKKRDLTRRRLGWAGRHNDLMAIH